MKMNRILKSVLCLGLLSHTIVSNSIFTSAKDNDVDRNEFIYEDNQLNLDFSTMDQDTDTKKAVFSIDAGRKYFSKNQIKELINQARISGYTDIQLILGNDGLRFLLDDMTIEANGKIYKSDDVKEALVIGNNEYYNDPNGNYLSQQEMDEILAYAKKLNVGIIPVINSPGHMDAILVAMSRLGIDHPMYQSSKRTIDLNNEEAIAFNLALIQKYVNYFSKYSTIFNLGCDEYANDVDTGGWQKLQDRGEYPKFIEYVNVLANIVSDANMRPMCFNDGIYYNSADEFGTFNNNILISYWTAGWWGFNVAKAKFLSEKGHQILNTNDGWYWVLGNLGNTGYNFNNAMKNINDKAFTSIVGDLGDTRSIGSVQAVWCDDPSQPHDMPRIKQLMNAFSTKYHDYMIQYANYNELHNVLASIPTDTTGYTNESVDFLNNKIKEIEWNLTDDMQHKVDEFVVHVQNAIDGLVVDKEILRQEIAKAPINGEMYTSKSWYDYQKMLESAKVVLEDQTATIQDVKIAVMNLQEAYANLQFKTPIDDQETVVDPSTTDNSQTNTPLTGDTVHNGFVFGVLLLVSSVMLLLRKKIKN